MNGTHDSYAEAVSSATQYFIDSQLQHFLSTFHAKKNTVIILPGGLASGLFYADRKFDQVSHPSEYRFDQVWLDRGIYCGDGKTLPIDAGGHDRGSRPVVASEAIDFMGLRPYHLAEKFLKGRASCNVLVLGWDWRRDLSDAVATLRYVLDRIKKHVGSRKAGEVLGNLFLVGHSMGGMVAKLFFSAQKSYAARLGGMISVGTPFYGYIAQLRRLFDGERELNLIYTPKTVATIVASFPGLYSLLPIDTAAFNRDGAKLGLTEYPVVDAATNAAADPYALATKPPYPGWVPTAQIARGLAVCRKLQEPLPDPLGRSVHHLYAAAPDSTPVAACWKQDLAPDYDPNKHTVPVWPSEMGQGDEVIPHWSARLASTPPDNVHKFPQGEHMLLMEKADVLRTIVEIVTRGRLLVGKTEFEDEFGPEPKVARAEDTEAFLREFLAQIEGRDRDELLRGEHPPIPEDIRRRILQNAMM